ncbi:hypothetical protein AVEN_133762-1 [Araneus ventricosus]|uniref:Uncharacterized protein n=1 Tax=Araneus ventricosus TaxID=182803 RepID=A0A4Y2RWR0_ARAVE|nr:hypothetical protein AVEN_133762-1 [Araneus ventricosus]
MVTQCTSKPNALTTTIGTFRLKFKGHDSKYSRQTNGHQRQILSNEIWDLNTKVTKLCTYLWILVQIVDAQILRSEVAALDSV